jgi:hypothetical protein
VPTIWPESLPWGRNARAAPEKLPYWKRGEPWIIICVPALPEVGERGTKWWIYRSLRYVDSVGKGGTWPQQHADQ